MTQVIDGRQIALRIEKEVELEVQALMGMGVEPTLAAVMVGENPASEIYVRNQRKACSRTGIGYRTLSLSSDTTENGLMRELARLNRDESVTGIMLQMPLPPHISPRVARRGLAPEKDVEGVHPENLGFLLSGRPTLVPCTAAAALACIHETGVALEGLEAVVVGHSEIVGKPIALLLMESLTTVSVCHHRTLDLRSHTRRADLVVVAVGKPGLLDVDALKEQSIVIDVGINEVRREDGRMEVVGDVDVSSVFGHVRWLTPVPGGVGPVTVAKLLQNTVRAAARQVRFGT